jgi:hypothetical protein
MAFRIGLSSLVISVLFSIGQLQAAELFDQVLDLKLKKADCEEIRDQVGQEVKKLFKLKDILSSCMPYTKEPAAFGLVLFSNQKIPAIYGSARIGGYSQNYTISVPYSENVNVPTYKDGKIECCKTVVATKVRYETRTMVLNLANPSDCEQYIEAKVSFAKSKGKNSDSLFFCALSSDKRSSYAVEIHPFAQLPGSPIGDGTIIGGDGDESED